jgi:hypothetical protein
MSLTELIIFETPHSKVLNILLENYLLSHLVKIFNAESTFYDVELSGLDRSLLVFHLSQICLCRLCIHTYVCERESDIGGARGRRI